MFPPLQAGIGFPAPLRPKAPKQGAPQLPPFFLCHPSPLPAWVSQTEVALAAHAVGHLLKVLQGKGGLPRGFMAMLISFMGLSSAAARLEERAPHRRHRWMMAPLPPLRTHTATGSIMPPQSDARSRARCPHAGWKGSWGSGCGDRFQRRRGHQAAHLAGEALLAGMVLVIAFFVLLSFVLSVHVDRPPEKDDRVKIILWEARLWIFAPLTSRSAHKEHNTSSNCILLCKEKIMETGRARNSLCHG